MTPDDWTDRHVARWRDHWIDIPFEDDVEAIGVRMHRLVRHLRGETQRALAEVGLADHEYETLHLLMVRETPGRATPGELAADLGISNAGMTGRLDALEKAGWVRRTPDRADRRRVAVAVTEAGETLWRSAMARRGRSEVELVHALSASERGRLAALLKKLTLSIGDVEPPEDPEDPERPEEELRPAARPRPR